MCNPVVDAVVAQLREEFPAATVTCTCDGTGGGDVIIEPVDLGERYTPAVTWFGARLAPDGPYADVYPLFVGGNVAKTNGTPHQTPISPGHTFAGRPALQVSRKTKELTATPEATVLKFVSTLHYIKDVAQ